MTFAMLGKYSAESIRDVSAKRTRTVSQLITKYKGKVKSIYVLLGDTDVLILAEFPNADALAKASVAITRDTGIAFSSAVAIPAKDFDKLVANL